MSSLISHRAQYSLRNRLVLAFGVLLILFLGLAGFVLDRAFKESVRAAVEERLQLQIYALLGVAEPEAGGFFVPDLEEARFTQIDSGLYGFIFNERGEEVWRSPSALNVNLAQSGFTLSDLEPGETLFGELETSRQGEMSFASYGTYWAGQDREYSFVVMESVAPTAAEIRQFQSSLWFWLGGLALLLSLLQYLLLRWGLSPLRRLADDVSRIESGASDRLQSNYPTELQAVAENLNLLISNERERQRRYRTTLGDLAHSLKTPLAVIAGIVEEHRRRRERREAMEEIDEQVTRMNQIVSYQLKRAVQANSAGVLVPPVAVRPVFDKILSALRKVYFDKGMELQVEIPGDARFYGDESDLTELAGNLLDNAFKYGHGQVRVAVSQQDRRLQIDIENDGEGIDEPQRQRVIERGARADAVKGGQGIGLAVAVDIVRRYNGEISLGESALGGAGVRVVFP